MSPKMGRPLIGEIPKNKHLGVRVSQETVDKFQKCAELLGKTKVNLFEDMVDELYERLTKE